MLSMSDLHVDFHVVWPHSQTIPASNQNIFFYKQSKLVDRCVPGMSLKRCDLSALLCGIRGRAVTSVTSVCCDVCFFPSTLDSSLLSNIQKLFYERIEVFGAVDFYKLSIVTGIIKIFLKVQYVVLFPRQQYRVVLPQRIAVSWHDITLYVIVCPRKMLGNLLKSYIYSGNFRHIGAEELIFQGPFLVLLYFTS